MTEVNESVKNLQGWLKETALNPAFTLSEMKAKLGIDYELPFNEKCVVLKSENPDLNNVKLSFGKWEFLGIDVENISPVVQNKSEVKENVENKPLPTESKPDRKPPHVPKK